MKKGNWSKNSKIADAQTDDSGFYKDIDLHSIEVLGYIWILKHESKGKEMESCLRYEQVEVFSTSYTHHRPTHMFFFFLIIQVSRLRPISPD